MMQTTTSAKTLRSYPPGYITILQQAINTVPGFELLYREMERSLIINGRSTATVRNYSRNLAHLALFYQKLPLDLSSDQVMEYLYFLKKEQNRSDSNFKFAVYGLRYACRLRGLPYKQFSLPGIKRSRRLPVVLNASEIKELLKACRNFKHRLLIGLCYGCGLRCGEVRKLRVADIDIERGMIHVREAKGMKDRCLPMGNLLRGAIQHYLSLEKPAVYLFEGNNGKGYAQAPMRWVIAAAVKRTGIRKQVTLHVLRHTYATHLLEQGVNILVIKDLLGHADIYTTMQYLHLARPSATMAFSPLDTLYHPLR